MLKQDYYKSLRGGGIVLGIGFILVTSTIIGLALGYWLDSILGTKPWLLIIFTLLGIAAGFIEIFRIVLGLSKD